MADDPIGAARETDPTSPGYAAAFAEIARNPQELLLVGVLDGEVVATAQRTILTGLSRQGAKRALIEAVRVRSDLRDRGLGRQLITWIIADARAQGCAVVQLTTAKPRVDAQRFYVTLGFEPSHIGMKLVL